MHKDIINFINSCEECQLYKPSHKQYGSLSGSLQSFPPWHTVALDHIGPFTSSTFSSHALETVPDDEYKYALTIIDLGTRMVELIPQRTLLAEETAKAFDHSWLCRYPRPTQVLVDQGPTFIADTFRELCSSFGIKLIFTSSGNARGNSTCERIHSFINNSLRCAQNPLWHDELPAISWSLRSTYHSRLLCTPGELAFGYNMLAPTLPLDSYALWRKADTYSKKRSDMDLAQANEYRVKHTFKEYEQVYVKVLKPNKGDQRYTGPYRILQVYANGSCKVDFGNYHEAIPLRRLKPLLGEKQNVALTLKPSNSSDVSSGSCDVSEPVALSEY
jgi:transposase InsO family protein